MVMLLDSRVRDGQPFVLHRQSTVDGGPPLVCFFPLSFPGFLTQGQFVGMNPLLFLPHDPSMRVQRVERVPQHVSHVIERRRCRPHLLSPFIVVEPPDGQFALPAAVVTVHLLLDGLTHLEPRSLILL